MKTEKTVKTGDRETSDKEWILALLRKNPMPVYLIDETPSGRFIITGFNNALLQETGFSPEKLSGSCVDELEYRDFGHFLSEKARLCLKAGKPLEFIGEYQLPSGRRISQTVLIPFKDPRGRNCRVAGVVKDMTQFMEIREAQAEQVQEFRTLAENSPNIIMRYDRECRRIYVNPAYARQTGIPVESAVGSSPNAQWQIHLDMLSMSSEEYHRRIRRVFDTGESDLFPVEWYRLSDGGYVAHELHVVAERDGSGKISGVLAIGHEITERKRMTEELSRREREFRTLAENSPDSITRYNREGRRSYVNRTFIQLMGLPEEELLNKKPFESNSTPDAAVFETALAEVFQYGEMREVEYFLPVAGGRKIFNQVRMVPEFDEEGEVISVLATGRDITELWKAKEEIEHMASYDTLTDLPNRRILRDRTTLVIAAARRHKKKAALLFIDLDNFKAVNDSLGHPAGDAFLKEISWRLRSAIRETDTVGRQGGDEFVVVLEEIESADGIIEFLSRIFNNFERPVILGEHTLFASMSVGIALFPDNGEDFDTLLKKADTAMFDAKKAGRNTYRFFSDGMNRTSSDHLKLHNLLKQALVHNQFELFFQPQTEAETGLPKGAEALLRWFHPEEGMIPPDKFIPVAEANGLILPIGNWVLGEACRQAAKWEAQRYNLTVAVNISAIQFKQKGFEKAVFSALERSGLSPGLLDLELTESILIQDAEMALDKIRRLKNHGIQISIDDFGTGYSSMAYLKKIDADTLKIDQSFVRDVTESENDAAIVRAIIQMAKSLDIALVAEGVEDRETFEFLKGLSCDFIQGYYFSRPLPEKEFLEYCRRYSASSGKAHKTIPGPDDFSFRYY